MSASSKINVNWITEESAAQTFVSSARDVDAPVLELKRWEPGPEELDDYADASFEPLTVVAVIVAVGWLIGRISDVLADHTRPGGLLVDARRDVLVRPLPKEARGKFVILTEAGAQVFTPDRRDEALTALTTLLGSPHG